MNRLLIIALALATIGCASSGAGKALNVGVIGAAAADVVTTQQAIGRGAVEANPLMGPQAWRQVAVKSAGVGVVWAGAQRLEQRGHPVWAQVVRGAAMSLWLSAAMWNQGMGRTP